MSWAEIKKTINSNLGKPLDTLMQELNLKINSNISKPLDTLMQELNLKVNSNTTKSLNTQLDEKTLDINGRIGNTTDGGGGVNTGTVMAKLNALQNSVAGVNGSVSNVASPYGRDVTYYNSEINNITVLTPLVNVIGNGCLNEVIIASTGNEYVPNERLRVIIDGVVVYDCLSQYYGFYSPYGQMHSGLFQIDRLYSEPYKYKSSRGAKYPLEYNQETDSILPSRVGPLSSNLVTDRALVILLSTPLRFKNSLVIEAQSGSGHGSGTAHTFLHVNYMLL